MKRNSILNKKKNNTGITLVALIITIIVLLILAVVAIRAVQGDGIIIKGKEARRDSEIARIREEIRLELMNLVLIKQGEDYTNSEVQTIVEKCTGTHIELGQKKVEIEEELEIPIEDFWVKERMVQFDITVSNGTAQTAHCEVKEGTLWKEFLSGATDILNDWEVPGYITAGYSLKAMITSITPETEWNEKDKTISGQKGGSMVVGIHYVKKTRK